MNCNNSECMKTVFKNKGKFKGTVYCMNGRCAYVDNSSGFCTYSMRPTGVWTEEIKLQLPVQDKFSSAQAELDELAKREGLSECVVNVILRKETANER